MSKNTNISELINYLTYDGSGNVVFTTVSAAASNTDKFLVSDAGTLKFRTAAQLLSDIGAQASGSYQSALSGTGFVKISGTTISYDNSTYATQTYVTTAISNLVASAPSTLDTLNELATALGNDANFATTVATSIGTKQPQLNGTGFVKVTGTTVSYDNSTYLTTSTAGTTYVPYTGATANVNLGVYNLAGGNVNINGGGSGGGALRLKQFAGSEANLEGYNSISTLTSGVFYFTSSASVPNFKNFVLNPSGLTDNIVRTYALPDASGTLALTSNLSSYLPLAGGTLTGALNAPSASFSGAASVINTFNLYKTGGTTLGGQLAYDSAVNQLYLWNNVTGGYFSIYTNSTERLTILPGGNVGLGTNSPIKNLQVYASNGNGIGIGRNLTNDNFSANLFFYPSSISADKRNWAITTYFAGPGLMEFRRSTTTTADPYDSGVTVMSLDSITDFVGIGTTSPAQKLHVKTSTNYQGILINGSNAPAIGFAKGDGTTPEWKLGISGNDGTAFSISSGAANTDKIIIGSSGRVGINDGVSTNAQLALNGSVKINRSLYNWYQESYVGNSTYLHIKTNLWAGGSPSGNIEYTMSLFKGYMYAYGTPPALEGTIVFHNWDGNFYNIGTTGNLFVTAYKSTDGYVVLVTNSGGGEAGITIDWHQAYGYPYKDRIRTASKLYGATTGGY